MVALCMQGISLETLYLSPLGLRSLPPRGHKSIKITEHDEVMPASPLRVVYNGMDSYLSLPLHLSSASTFRALQLTSLCLIVSEGGRAFCF